jgi:hypothetical protein
MKKVTKKRTKKAQSQLLYRLQEQGKPHLVKLRSLGFDESKFFNAQHCWGSVVLALLSSPSSSDGEIAKSCAVSEEVVEYVRKHMD